MESAGSVVQMVLSLAAVVAVILGLAWMTRRMQGLRGASNGALRVKATIAVGMKERVVLIEASGRQFLIGVAPGQVRLIETLGAASEEPAAVQDLGATSPAGGAGAPPSLRESFAHQLGQLLGR
jgi:flagellar protein FliO/FliZ